MRLTIKTKLAGAFGVVIALSMAAGGLSYIKLSEMTETQERLVVLSKRVDDIGNVLEAFGSSARSEKNAVLAASQKDTEAQAARAVERRHSAMTQTAALANGASEEGRRFLAQITEKANRYGAIQDETLANAKLNSSNRATTAWQTETVPLIQAITAATNPVIAAASRPDASPEMLRAALAFQEARLEWLRLTRTAALAFNVQTVAEVEKLNKELGDQALSVRAKLGKAATELNQLGLQTAAMTAAFDKGIASALHTVGIAAEAGTIKATSSTMTTGATALTELTAELDGYSTFASKAANNAAVAASEAAAFAKTLLISILVASLLIAIAAATWIALNISRGLASAVGLANAVAIGDLSQNIAVKSNDEIGDLVTSLNTMTANLNATAAVADAIANGDLTVEAKRLSDKDTLGISLENMLDKLRTIVTQAIQAAENVSSGSQELSASAEQLSQGSTEQASSTEEASSSMEEMAANVKQNAENAATTEKMAGQSAKDAEASGIAVGKAVDAMQTIAAKINI
ncbi:MAG TPA: HAMP domain-containing protein, partial [Bosea sp. (in: a-proteobacteria)]|uniref:HAMP domain-containing protein n=1 Tax=Bosea sp. (in: a-proteobacteria) TaxID=1871050 RepID=UPI002E104FF5|nr:HAMP domain-containing protein [Bosea sp. (in: a-proteobacteria)]